MGWSSTMRILFCATVLGVRVFNFAISILFSFFNPGGLRELVRAPGTRQMHRADDGGAATRFFLNGHGPANHPGTVTHDAQSHARFLRPGRQARAVVLDPEI